MNVQEQVRDQEKGLEQEQKQVTVDIRKPQFCSKHLFSVSIWGRVMRYYQGEGITNGPGIGHAMPATLRAFILIKPSARNPKPSITL